MTIVYIESEADQPNAMHGAAAHITEVLEAAGQNYIELHYLDSLRPTETLCKIVWAPGCRVYGQTLMYRRLLEARSMPIARVRTLRVLTPYEAAHQHSAGDRVLVGKYGGVYSAKVTQVGRTRLTVQFTTHGGKLKIITIPPKEVCRP